MRTIFKIILFISALQFAGALIDKHIDWRITFNQTVSSDLNLRMDTTFSDNIITVIPAHSLIEVVNTSSSWAQIDYANTTGFVSTDYLIEDQLRPSQVFFTLWIILHLTAMIYFTVTAKARFFKSIALFVRNFFSPWIAFRLIITLLKKSFSKQKDLEIITFKHSAA